MGTRRRERWFEVGADAGMKEQDKRKMAVTTRIGIETIARTDRGRDGDGNEETRQERYGVRARIGNETIKRS